MVVFAAEQPKLEEVGVQTTMAPMLIVLRIYRGYRGKLRGRRRDERRSMGYIAMRVANPVDLTLDGRERVVRRC